MRKRVRAEYEKAQRDLARARAQLQQFEQIDRPEFSRWFHTAFGRLLTKIRDLALRVEEAERLILEIQREIWFSEVTADVAYRRVMRRRQRLEHAGERREEPWEGEESRFRAPPNSEASDRDDGDEEPTKRGTNSRGKRSGTDEGAPSSRLKELYRALTKRLHPDTRSRSDARMMEWWHMTQDAYARGDVDQLEVILALYEVEMADQATATSVGLLQCITHQFKRACRELRRQLSRYKNDPAWNFSKLKTRWILESRFRNEMTAQVSGLKDQLEMYLACLAHWRGGR